MTLLPNNRNGENIAKIEEFNFEQFREVISTSPNGKLKLLWYLYTGTK